MSGRWRHNDDEQRWELGYYTKPDLPRDDPGGEWQWAGYITDEFIDRTAFTPVQLAVRMFSKFRSVPPPLAGHLPPAPPPALFEGSPR